MRHATDTRRTLRLGFAATLCGVAALLAVSEAHAQQCTSDADCSPGFQCVKGESVPGCATPSDCPDPTPVQDTTGSCEQAPISCQTGADCPSYLKCVANESQTCWVSSDGDAGCDPPDPNAPKTCTYVTIACASDTDCPANFACTDVPTPCPSIACAPGTDCPPSDCTGTTQKECSPKQITCQTSSDCPTDWLCADVSPNCGSTTPVAVDGGTTEPAPAPGPAPAPAPGNLPQDTSTNDCANATPIMMCVPPGFSSGSSYSEAAGTPSAADNAAKGAAATSSSPDEGTGCSTTSSRPQGAGWLAALSAAALASIVSRRLRRR